jgi:hypothetical protein
MPSVRSAATRSQRFDKRAVVQVGYCGHDCCDHKLHTKKNSHIEDAYWCEREAFLI